MRTGRSLLSFLLSITLAMPVGFAAEPPERDKVDSGDSAKALCGKYKAADLACDMNCRIKYLGKTKEKALGLMDQLRTEDKKIQACFQTSAAGCKSKAEIKKMLFGDNLEQKFKEMRRILGVRSDHGGWGSTLTNMNMFSKTDQSKIDGKISRDIGHVTGDAAKLKQLDAMERVEAASEWDTEYALQFQKYRDGEKGKALDECGALTTFRKSEAGNVNTAIKAKYDGLYHGLINRNPALKYITSANPSDAEISAVLEKIGKTNVDARKQLEAFKPKNDADSQGASAIALANLGSKPYFDSLLKSTKAGATPELEAEVKDACRGLSGIIESIKNGEKTKGIASNVATGLGVGGLGLGILTGITCVAIPFTGGLSAPVCAGMATVSGGMMVTGAAVGTTNALAFGMGEWQLARTSELYAGMSTTSVFDQARVAEADEAKRDSVKEGAMQGLGFIGGIKQGQGVAELSGWATTKVKNWFGAKPGHMSATEVQATRRAVDTLDDAEMSGVTSRVPAKVNEVRHDEVIADAQAKAVKRGEDPQAAVMMKVDQPQDVLEKFAAKDLDELSKSNEFKRFAEDNGYRVERVAVKEKPGVTELELRQDINQPGRVIHPSVIEKTSGDIGRWTPEVVEGLKRGASPRAIASDVHNAQMRSQLGDIAGTYVRSFPAKRLADQPLAAVYKDAKGLLADSTKASKLTKDEVAKLSRFRPLEELPAVEQMRAVETTRMVFNEVKREAAQVHAATSVPALRRSIKELETKYAGNVRSRITGTRANPSAEVKLVSNGRTIDRKIISLKNESTFPGRAPASSGMEAATRAARAEASVAVRELAIKAKIFDAYEARMPANFLMNGLRAAERQFGLTKYDEFLGLLSQADEATIKAVGKKMSGTKPQDFGNKVNEVLDQSKACSR